MGTKQERQERTSAQLREFAARITGVAALFTEAAELLDGSGLKSASVRNVPLSGTAAYDLEKSGRKVVADVKKAISEHAIREAGRRRGREALEREAAANKRPRRRIVLEDEKKGQ